MLPKPVNKFQPNCVRRRKNYQLLFLGGVNTLPSNPRWRTATILKSNIVADSDEILHGDTEINWRFSTRLREFLYVQNATDSWKGVCLLGVSLILVGGPGL